MQLYLFDIRPKYYCITGSDENHASHCLGMALFSKADKILKSVWM